MKYEISKYDLNEIGRNGYGSISIKVEGYWSSDPITLYVRRDHYGTNGWGINLSHSSGGRDTKVVECDLEAEVNFANALIGAVSAGQFIQSKFEELEIIYQEERRLEREAEEIRKAEQAKKAEADVPCGDNNARYLIQCMKAKIMKERYAEIKYFNRGSDTANGVISLERVGVRSTFRIGGVRSNYNQVIGFLANRSNRSQMV